MINILAAIGALSVLAVACVCAALAMASYRLRRRGLARYADEMQEG